ncbi:MULTISPECIES: energy transducer TonB [Pedobacter]|uniref:TonB family protein n=1 Tax=Pedobacter heparinus (strain ATCC 13125 / DSM 2366 / CIP 104194 / JCM 7457 / NBRC 12017 / NCIMB 9290 / NRRL B-14731 / HIM 762-3) TaxID=485917 RepID=C6XZC4_PEDHD|nr:MULTISPECIES: energy transducer TonB [Pedobacter]ACU04620.1 TonB family protein [Pedobacter heparinus DSM 2366]MBB5437529.1 TonB family protein [Pedobacter sp. AK017]
MILRTTIFVLCLLLSGIVTYAQKTDTTYYDKDWEPSTKALGSYFRITKTIEEGKRYEVTDYFKSGKIQMTGAYTSLSPEVKDGEFIWYDEQGKKEKEAVYVLGKLRFKKDYRAVPPPNGATEFVSLEKQPVYPGGINKLYKYIGANFVYPKSMLKLRPKGTIKVSFLIEKDGSVSEVYVKESVHPLLDAEAIRVIEGMEKWEPGIQSGKPVRVAYNIPIKMN